MQTYPFLIFLAIFLSQKYGSVLAALIGCTPIILFLALRGDSWIEEKQDFQNHSKDFICSDDSYLTFTNTDIQIRDLDLYSRKSSFSYHNRVPIASVAEDK